MNSFARQEDYNGDDAELVPEGLRVYRHMTVDEQGYGPTSMGIGTKFKPGVNVAKCHAPLYQRASIKCPDCKGQGRRCEDEEHPPYAPYVDCHCLINCEAPRVDCQCGFYASYDPETNFFDEYRFQAVGGFAQHLPPVFAVVEMSGRVLMGKRGVRAEKMRIVATAIDLKHVEHTQTPVLRRSLGMRGFSSPYWSPSWTASDEERELMYGPFSGPSLGERVADLRSLMSYTGVPSYGIEMDRMIREHPKPDISHLINREQHG